MHEYVRVGSPIKSIFYLTDRVYLLEIHPVVMVPSLGDDDDLRAIVNNRDDDHDRLLTTVVQVLLVGFSCHWEEIRSPLRVVVDRLWVVDMLLDLPRFEVAKFPRLRGVRHRHFVFIAH